MKYKGIVVLGFFIGLISSSVHAQLIVDTGISGINTDHTGGYMGSGVSFADFNGDGLDDLSFGHHDGSIAFYIGTGSGFESINLGIELPSSEAKSILWADIDNDGDQDLFVSFRLAPNMLWLNDGNLGLSDVSSSCGIAQDNRRSFGASFGDFDKDGLLDLFIANLSQVVDVPPGNELYRNLGDGQFENVTDEYGLGGMNLQSFQPTWMDIDRDGWLDLHVIRDRTYFPNLLYHNKGVTMMGAPMFVEEGEIRGLNVGLHCMSSSPHDFDRDGDLDVFLSGGLEGNVLLENTGEGTYLTSESSAVVAMNEVCWSGQWLDIDADGWEELHVATSPAVPIDYPSILDYYDNELDGLFLNATGTLQDQDTLFESTSILSYSTAIGDYNGDGFIDFVSHCVGEVPEIRMSFPNDHNVLRILLHGTTSNRDAIGSKIEIWAGDDYWYRETYCGEGYLAQNSRWEHFGLMDHTVVDSIRVQWPIGGVDAWYDVPAQTALELEEGTTCMVNCPGCTYPNACNFNLEAIQDDGSCDFSCLFENWICDEGLLWDPILLQCVPSCMADFNGDNLVNIEDLMLMLGAFGGGCSE